jgi:hypothetical protein
MTQAKDEALKLTLEALKIARDQIVDPEYAPIGWSVSRLDEVLSVGKQALAAQPAPVQPVAWACWEGDMDPSKDEPLLRRGEPRRHVARRPLVYGDTPPAAQPAPVQPEWVGLKDEESLHILDAYVGKPSEKHPLTQSDWLNFSQGVEAKLREKNGAARPAPVQPVACLSETQARAILDLALELEKTGRVVAIAEGQERADFVARNRNIQCALEDALRSATTPLAQPAVPLTDELSNAVQMACQLSFKDHGRRSVNEQAWQRLMQALAAYTHCIPAAPKEGNTP